VTKKHGGVDMAADQGTDVRASAPGTIIRVEQGVLGYGTVIEIQHIGGFMTRYGHLATVLVQQGQKVERAEVIGTVGSTGNVRGKGDPSHLHFEVVQSGKRLDPLRYLYCAEVAFQKS
jgi:murein DD-endopeptidase MepM/ murein hydrolase activator NlpD